MYKHIFDTHAHYDDLKFDEDRDELLSSLPEKGVEFVINCGCDLKSSKKSIELCEKYKYFYCALGIHPSEISNNSETEFQSIKVLTNYGKCVAVGEIGLDYHYDFVPKDKQLEFFEKQLQFATEADLPVIVHDREAHEDTLTLLKKYKPKGVLHCFSGSVEMAKEIIKLGMYIGLGGAVTFKNARKPLEVAEYLPEDRLLLETDCPYMAPVPNRGKRCTSDMIALTAEKIAEVRKTDTQQLIDKTKQNAFELFSIK
ncbi:MAG: TatD family hydrolase [Clostridia bacterium]|nr:TatD family hydrolase [Clostridia bacterium]